MKVFPYCAYTSSPQEEKKQCLAICTITENIVHKEGVQLLAVFEIVTLTGLENNGHQDVANNFIHQEAKTPHNRQA